MSKHRIGWTKKQLLAKILVLEAQAKVAEAQIEELSRECCSLEDMVNDRDMWLNDPEGTIQKGINARYSRDLRDRELEHHALWDEEVAVFQAAASRRMRGLAADVATAAGAVEVAEQIAALPVYAEEAAKS